MPKPTLQFKPNFPFFQQVYNTGLVLDPRGPELKKFDFAHEERVFNAGAADSFSFAKITQSLFFYENQWYIGSCVPHGTGLGFIIERKADKGDMVRVAQLFPYRQRPSYPVPGTYIQAMMDSYRNKGAPLFTTLPTKPGMTEAEATALVLTPKMFNEAAILKGGNYFMIKNYTDIGTLATVAAAGHGVPVCIYGSVAEWSKEYPTVDDPKLRWMDAAVRHCVCVLPNSGFIENGVRFVAIQDSAWFGGLKLRYLSEDFVARRVVDAAYWDTVGEYAGGPRPHHVFTKILKYGDKGPEVAAMQQLLISEKLLPPDCATGNFLGMTLGGLHAFQNKYADKILVPQGLDAPTDVFGSMSIAEANTLCATN